MEFLSQTYVALRGPTGAPQSPLDTISRLSDRLSPSTLLADRRAAVLALKGVAREYKSDVVDRALPGLLGVLENDAEVDGDVAKAVLETLNTLCEMRSDEVGLGKELGARVTDEVLKDEKVVHKLFALLADTTFYTRFATLQFLGTLLLNRRQSVQKHFLTAPAGPTSIASVLQDKREIIRNETIPLLRTLLSQSPDIQKLLAFSMTFERLFSILEQEGGIDGGVVVQDVLESVDGLLRFNTSNQSYFRETPLPPHLPALLLFPPSLPLSQPAPQEFALQFWDPQRLSNAKAVVGILGMLVNSKGGNALEVTTFTRCLLELALASNAPTSLKTQALLSLPPLPPPLPSLPLTPYLPVPNTNGEEWDRLEPSSALDVLVELALHGEYHGLGLNLGSIGGAGGGGGRRREVLEVRCAAGGVFENFVTQADIRLAILQAMLPSSTSDPAPTTPLLHALTTPPTPPLSPPTTTTIHFACLLFSHLVRGSGRAKAVARGIKPPSPLSLEPSIQDRGQFFVPAEGVPPPHPSEAPPPSEDEEDTPATLLCLLSDHLSLAFLARSRSTTSDRETREWDRLIVAYLSLLCQWLWEDPPSVREFLDAGGLGVLVEPINQTEETDVVVPGLCAFLLGICYEFNRQPGEITRATIHPILTRLGIDSLLGRMARLREDERLKAVSPESVVLPYPTPGSSNLNSSLNLNLKPEVEDEAEVWFDWPFVDFVKSNYYTVQRAIGTDPNSLSAPGGLNAETEMLVVSLREVIRSQAQEIESLQTKLKESASGSADELKALQDQVSNLSSSLQSSEVKRKELEKEQEDLLVLLDELSTKRTRDKERLKEAGLPVSEDEGDEEDEEDGGEEE